MIIAIDGPSGAGKSTIAQAVGEKLGFLYIDTGAMYRALTWKWLEKGPQGVPTEEALLELLQSLKMFFDKERLWVNGQLAEPYIRGHAVTEKVAQISSYPAVREYMTHLQRKIAADKNCVLEGRDIATKVFPEADLKIFLTASLETRAKRRHAQLCEKTEGMSLQDIQSSIKNRDHSDSHRVASPLEKASDAIEIRSDGKSIGQVTDEIIALAKERL